MTIVDIRSDRVRVGIEAPVEIPVHRLEIQEMLDRENRAAAQPVEPPCGFCASRRTIKILGPRGGTETCACPVCRPGEFEAEINSSGDGRRGGPQG